MLMCGVGLTIMASGLISVDPTIVEMSIDPIKSGGVDNPIPRTPVSVPTVLQDDHTLYITGVNGDYILQLETASGVAYSVPIQGSTGSDTVVLPSSLSGTYELCLYSGCYCFSGEINL